MAENKQSPETAIAKAAPTAVTASKKLGDLQSLLLKYKPQFDMAIPEHLTSERLIRVAMTAVSQSPKLMECSALSICGAVMQAGILGLEPTSVLGECFLVPFKNKKANGGRGQMEAQLIIGYHGKIKLVANTGDLQGVKASPVRKNDEFQFDDGLEPFVSHKYHHIADRGPVIGYWAGARLKSGFTSIVFMTVKECEDHRDKFAMTKFDGKVFGVWVDNFEAMSLKTVIHKCLKYLPKSVRAATAWALDERAEAGIPQKFSVEVPLELQPVGSDDYDETPALDPIKEPREKTAPAATIEATAGETKKEDTPNIDKARQPLLEKFAAMEKNLGTPEFMRRLGAGPESYTDLNDIFTSKLASEFARMEKA